MYQVFDRKNKFENWEENWKPRIKQRKERKAYI